MCSPCFTLGWNIMSILLKEKIIRWFDGRDKKIDYVNSTVQKKEEAERASIYYFRNVIH